MPILEALAPTAINAVSTLLTNSANKKTALEMYNRQRTDALADWNMQNQYNSPAAQMQRYKDAGLNPHLIYGQTNTAPAVRSSTAETPKMMAPQVDPNLLLQLKLTQAQIKNVEASTNRTNAETYRLANENRFTDTNWDAKQLAFLSNAQRLKKLAELTGIKATMADVDSGFQKPFLQNRNNIQATELDRKKASIQNIIASTDLTYSKQSEVSQKIATMAATAALLDEKTKTEKFENEIFQKIKAMGVVGSTAIQLLRLIMGK